MISEDTQAQAGLEHEDNSIVALCAKLTEGNTSLLCDISTVSMEDISMQSQDSNKDDDVSIAAMFGEIEFIDVKQVEGMVNRTAAVNELARKVAEKVTKEMEETKALLKKQKGIYSERKRLMDEFDKLRSMHEVSSSSNHQVELEQTSDKDPDIITWKDQIPILTQRYV